MKAKLLRKLRKEAKKQYWIEIDNKSIYRYKIYNIERGYYTPIDMFQILDEAVIKLKNLGEVIWKNNYI